MCYIKQSFLSCLKTASHNQSFCLGLKILVFLNYVAERVSHFHGCHGPHLSWSTPGHHIRLCARAFILGSQLLVSTYTLIQNWCSGIIDGIGAVLSNKMSDGSEKPVRFASEKKYSQVEKEILACVYSVKPFMICYTLSSVNLKQFQHAHPTGFRGGRGPLHQSSIQFSAMQQPWVSCCCFTHQTTHPSQKNGVDGQEATGRSNHSHPDSTMN